MNIGDYPWLDVPIEVALKKLAQIDTVIRREQLLLQMVKLIHKRSKGDS